MKEKLSIDQVAELAYVSRSVVSRVLNNHSNVSDEARERVLKVVKEHNYRPSSVARGLATNQSYEIGILAPRRCNEAFANGFWSLLHLGVFEECIEKGYYVTMSPISTEVGTEINDHILDDERFDGYISLTQEVTDYVLDLKNKLDIPMILVGHGPDSEEFTSVDVDNFLGAFKATNHLIRQGHSHIGVMLASLDMKESVDRFDGYKKAMDEAGLKVYDDYVSIGDYSYKEGFSTIKRWLGQGMDISAVLCMSDTLAMGALQALHKERVQVPEEIAVVGFDDLPFAQYTIPSLTTIQQPIYQKGKQAGRLLIDKIEGTETTASVHMNLEPNLIIRESCGAEVKANA